MLAWLDRWGSRTWRPARWCGAPTTPRRRSARRTPRECRGGGATRRTTTMDFPRIKRLPPYVFNIIGDLKQAARRAGEDVIDLGMGNPDGPTPPHVVQKLVESALKTPNHRY